jgi:DNA-binding HxlR family transcriptional regulator
LNPTIRALKELCALGAAKAQPSETLPDHRTYRLTPFGQRLVAQLSR